MPADGNAQSNASLNTRRAPNVRIHAFLCGREHLLFSLLDPADPRCGDALVIPYFRYLIEHPEGCVMFDTGAHPLVANDPAARVAAGDVDEYHVDVSDDEDIEKQLSALGLRPSDVADIVLSHLHFDHAGCIEWFPHARIHVQQDEYDFAIDPPEYQRAGYLTKDFAGDYDWQFRDADFDLFGDGSIVAFRTPGHTPGHQSLLVRMEHGAAILVGDAAYDREKMEQRRLPGFLWNPDKLLESWDRIGELQRQFGAQLILSHDRHYEREIRMAPGAYYD